MPRGPLHHRTERAAGHQPPPDALNLGPVNIITIDQIFRAN